MDRRAFLKFTALSPLALTLGIACDTPSRSRTYRLGMWAEPIGTETSRTALERIETRIGRHSDFVRHYVAIGEDWASKYVAWGAQGGRTPVIAVQSKDPQANSIKWSDIASGSYDDLISHQAQQLQTLATLPSVLVFHHEPENDSDGAPGPAASGRCGTPEDFRRAADRFRRVVRSAGVAISEALFGITLTQPTYATTHHYGGWTAWLPSDLDILGVDGYNRYPAAAPDNRSFGDLFTPARTVASKLGKPLFIQETGTLEDPSDPMAKAGWFDDARATSDGWPELFGVEYSHILGKEGSVALPFWIDTSEASLEAFTAWAHS